MAEEDGMKQQLENQITVHDTKGFFDTESECMKDYSTGTIEKKIQIFVINLCHSSI